MQMYEDYFHVMHMSFSVAQEVQKESQGGERWLQELEAYSKQDWGQHWSG